MHPTVMVYTYDVHLHVSYKKKSLLKQMLAQVTFYNGMAAFLLVEGLRHRA